MAAMTESMSGRRESAPNGPYLGFYGRGPGGVLWFKTWSFFVSPFSGPTTSRTLLPVASSLPKQASIFLVSWFVFSSRELRTSTSARASSSAAWRPLAPAAMILRYEKEYDLEGKKTLEEPFAMTLDSSPAGARTMPVGPTRKRGSRKSKPPVNSNWTSDFESWSLVAVAVDNGIWPSQTR